MKYTFTDLVDIKKLQELTDEIYQTIDLPCAILNNMGEILIQSGWPEICTNFHQKNPEISRRCLTADSLPPNLSENLEEFQLYQCPRGLVSAQVPVVINNEKIAIILSGQVLLEDSSEPALENFKKQAIHFGINEKEYLAEYESIPKFTEKKFKNALGLLARIAMMIADTGLSKLQELELGARILGKEKKTAELLQSILDSPNGIIIFSLDHDYRYLAFTTSHKETMKQIWGVDIETGMNMLDCILDPDDRTKAKNNFDRALHGEVLLFTEEYGDKTLYRTWWENRYSPIYGEHQTIVGLTCFVTDITNLKSAEQVAINNEIQLKALIDNVDGLVFSVDTHARLINYNAQFQEYSMLYQGRFANPGENLLEAPFISADLRKEWEDYHRRVMNGENLVIERPVRILGQTGYQSLSMRPVSNQKGEIEGMATIVRDITVQKTIENTLVFLAQHGYVNNSRSFFNALARFLSELLNMDYVAINSLTLAPVQAENLTVYFDGKYDSNIRYPLRNTPCEKVIEKILCCFPENVAQLFKEDEFLQEIQAESYIGISLISSEGLPIGFIAMVGRKPIRNQSLAENVLQMVSITAANEMERMYAISQLRESEEQFRSLYEGAMDPILIIDESFYFVDCNHATIEMLGAESKEQIINRPPAELSPEYQPDGQLSAVKAVLMINNAHVNGFTKFEWIHKKIDGELLTIEVSLNVIPKLDKKVLLVHWRDITERENNLQRLAKQTEELKSLNASKDKFFSIIAHDLKNPFNSILGFSDLLLKDLNKFNTQEITRYLGHINNSSRQAYALLENLLIWARIQRGAIDFQPEILDLTDIIANSIRLAENQASAKNIHITSTLSGHYVILADKNMIETILRNLITNSIKFTHANGYVMISAQYDNTDIIVTVSDNGVGISEENRESVFRIDSKTNTLGTEKEKGSGLGLILCKEFAEKHGGRIWFESETGKGTSFHFTLPGA